MAGGYLPYRSVDDFMRNRVYFIRPDGTTGKPFFGSCLVAWGHECDRRLRQSGIEGKYVVLNM